MVRDLAFLSAVGSSPLHVHDIQAEPAKTGWLTGKRRRPHSCMMRITLVMIYNARGEMSLVWALGKNTSPGREVGVNPNLLYLVIIYAFAHCSDAGTPKTIIAN